MQMKDEELAQLIEQLLFDPTKTRNLAAPSGIHQPTGDLGEYLKQFINSSSHRKSNGQR